MIVRPLFYCTSLVSLLPLSHALVLLNRVTLTSVCAATRTPCFLANALHLLSHAPDHSNIESGKFLRDFFKEDRGIRWVESLSLPKSKNEFDARSRANNTVASESDIL